MMSSTAEGEGQRQPHDGPEHGVEIDGPAVVAELRRLVAYPLAARHVGSFDVLPNLAAVRAVLPPTAGPTLIVRAIVEIIAAAIDEIDGQTVRLKKLPLLNLDASSLQSALGGLLGITRLGQTDHSAAKVRRAKAAEALGLDLDTLGGDRGFRENHEDVLLAILAALLISGDRKGTAGQTPSWFVENVTYHYRYNAERVLASTDYTYDVLSQRDGRDFFINHTAATNLGRFEAIGWRNCELLEQNQLANRTVELHFRLANGAPGSRTRFSYRLKPTDPHMSEENPLLATIGQLSVASVQYTVDFEATPVKVWYFEAVPPPLAGAPQLEVPASDSARLLSLPYDQVSKSFRALKVRHFSGLAWKW